MRCMYSRPEDPMVQCIRDATVRFSHTVRLTHPLQQGDAATSYAYTCDQHEEVGPALAEAMSQKWAPRADTEVPAPTREVLAQVST